MNNETAEWKWSKIVALLEERARESKKIQALDRRIAELAGIVPEEQTRKQPRKALSHRDFARGCGL